MRDLFLGAGIAHSILVFAVVIAIGLYLGKFKLKGISIGSTWILFVAILLSHFGLRVDTTVLSFMKDFGLILFVFSIGLQVGPGFFHSFKKGGLQLNLLAVTLVLLAVAVTVAIHFISGEDLKTMVGVMSGAVTNTPGLGAAQQTMADSMRAENYLASDIASATSGLASAYAVAYPLGVLLVIALIMFFKAIFKVDLNKEKEALDSEDNNEDVARRMHCEVENPAVFGLSIKDATRDLGNSIVISRILRDGLISIPGPDTVLKKGDKLQMGDVLRVVGPEEGIAEVAGLVGNQTSSLNRPNLIPIFFGIAVGVIFGSIPIAIPGIPQPIKLGLAGGPLIIAILLGYFGPKWKITTYTTQSANLMIREIGISFFMAAVGLGAGQNFVSSIVNGGYWWILYGALITFIPVCTIGLVARYVCKLNFYQICGLISGGTTDPAVLAFTQGAYGTDYPSVNYATVYPLTMFMRVLVAQLLILVAIA